MDEETTTIESLWSEIKEHVEALEHDVSKNSRGVVAAGTRARKGLRHVKTTISKLVKLMITLDKQHKGKAKSE